MTYYHDPSSGQIAQVLSIDAHDIATVVIDQIKQKMPWHEFLQQFCSMVTLKPSRF